MSPPSTLNTDLTGLLDIQKNYLIHLGENSSEPGLSDKVDKLQTNLDDLYASFNNANISSSAVLTRQGTVSDIIDEEKARLEGKKQSIDNALVGKKRAINLNETYRMRQSQYLKIKVVFVIVLAICIGITLLNRRFQILPNIILSLIIMIIMLIGGIYCLSIYASIASRSPMNYDELDLTGPTVLSDSEIAASQAAAGKAGDLLGTIDTKACVGHNCCSDTTKWDSSKLLCVDAGCGEGKIWDSANEECVDATGFTLMGGPTAYVPSEYDSYGKI